MRIFILFITLILLVGCASITPYTPPPECVDQPSLILERFSDPRVIDKSLLAIHYAALKTVDGYTPEKANEVLDEIEYIVNEVDGLTYAELLMVITTKIDIANQEAGAIIFILGPDIKGLNDSIPISECDFVLIRKELDRHRMFMNLLSK